MSCWPDISVIIWFQSFWRSPPYRDTFWLSSLPWVNPFFRLPSLHHRRCNKKDSLATSEIFVYLQEISYSSNIRACLLLWQSRTQTEWSEPKFFPVFLCETSLTDPPHLPEIISWVWYSSSYFSLASSVLLFLFGSFYVSDANRERVLPKSVRKDKKYCMIGWIENGSFCRKISPHESQFKSIFS